MRSDLSFIDTFYTAHTHYIHSCSVFSVLYLSFASVLPLGDTWKEASQVATQATNFHSSAWSCHFKQESASRKNTPKKKVATC
jgi:hypothetical protein